MRFSVFGLVLSLLLTTACAAVFRSCRLQWEFLPKSRRGEGIHAKELRWKIDIQRAPACELRLLPGIGPSRAAAILRARERLGGFRSWKDLDEVEGIGPARLEELRRAPVIPIPESPPPTDLRYNPRDAGKETERKIGSSQP